MLRLSARLACGTAAVATAANLRRSFRVENISPIGPADVLLARQERVNFFSFLCYVGESPEAVANLLLSTRDEDRTFHTVFARDNIPCDFFGDLDMPGVSIATAEATVAEVMQCLEHRLKPFKVHKVQHLLLQSVGVTDKVSFHLHSRCHAAVFQDWRAVKTMAEEINKDMSRNVLDMAIYRPNGMIRSAFSRKVATTEVATLEGAAHTNAFEVYKPSPNCPSFLTEALQDNSQLSRRDVLTRSFALRGGTLPPSTKLIKSKSIVLSSIKDEEKAAAGMRDDILSGNDSSGAIDEHGNPVSRFMTEKAKWKRYNAAVLKLRQLPSKAAVDFSTWVRVGLALHNFSSDEAQFEEWVRFSVRCPQKFSREACSKKWAQFERNPDKANWRRGYNYLTVTIWRHLGI